MPVGSLKNTLYAMALPLLGKRCEWKTSGNPALDRVLKRHHVVGACIQRFERGMLTQCHTAGFASLEGVPTPVSEHTIFRTASVAKMVTALLVFRLQSKGLLSVQQDVSDFMGFCVRNPRHPDAPITLGMLLSHTSSIVDSPAYFASFAAPRPLEVLLKDPAAFHADVPGIRFRYSNLAAGMIGCMLEKRFGESFEKIAQKELFQPLGIEATFDMSTLCADRVADSWRVLPAGLGFSAKERIANAKPVSGPDPQRHYLLASGSLFLTAEALSKLTLAAWNGADGFLNEESLEQMHQPLLGWPDLKVNMSHGMGLLKLEDKKICSQPIWGHQGFAYGAVNGIFFDAEGNGFACLNSGASEQRTGHLACLNRDLIALWMKGNQ